MADAAASELFSVKGIVAVITGGGTGIGLMMAKTLDAHGASKVYIVGRRRDKLEAASKEGKNGSIIPVVGDVSSKESLEAVVEQVKSDVGYVNLVIANSGVPGPQIPQIRPDTTVAEFRAAALKVPMEDFTNTYHINTTAVFYTAIAFLELLDEGNKKGNMPGVKSQFLATASIGAFIRTASSGWAYTTSKAATTLLIKQLATNFVAFSIRANALAPGLIYTDLAAPLLAQAKKEPTVEGAFDRSFIPAERTGSETDVAGTLLYMASKAGAYNDGNIVVLDGGRMSIVPATY